MDALLGRHVDLAAVRKIGEGTFGEAFRAGCGHAATLAAWLVCPCAWHAACVVMASAEAATAVRAGAWC